MIMVARGGIPLVGRTHAEKLGNLTLKTDKNVKNSPVFSLGSVIASSYFINMKRTVQRQYRTFRADRDYKMERLLDSANNIVGNDHQDMAILLGDTVKKTWKLEVYITDPGVLMESSRNVYCLLKYYT